MVGQAAIYVWVAVEAAGGRNRGDVSCIEPGVLLQGHVRLGDRAVVPSLHGGADGCMVKRVLQTDAKSYKLEDLRTLPVSFDLQGVRRKSQERVFTGSPSDGGSSASRWWAPT